MPADPAPYLAAGAKGLIFYTGGQTEVYRTDLFKKLKKLAGELKKQNWFLYFPNGEVKIKPPFYVLEKEIPKKGIYQLIVNSQAEECRFGDRY